MRFIVHAQIEAVCTRTGLEPRVEPRLDTPDEMCVSTKRLSPRYGAGSPAAAVAKLVSTVLVPVVVGMVIRAIPGVGERLGSKPVKSKLKLTSDVIILAIIYNTFCNTFKSGFGVATGEVTALGLVLAAGPCLF